MHKSIPIRPDRGVPPVEVSLGNMQDASHWLSGSAIAIPLEGQGASLLTRHRAGYWPMMWNPRATHLRWLLNGRGEHIVGHAIVVGDDIDTGTDVWFQSRCGPNCSSRPATKCSSAVGRDDGWVEYADTYDDYFDAALRLRRVWHGARKQFRVVPEEGTYS